MASRAPAHAATPLDVLLASVPSLPRALLSRLTARMIERLDELDGDADLEPDEDRCAAGDDTVCAGLSPGLDAHRSPYLGSDDDAEPMHASAFDRNQTPRPQARYTQPRRRRKPPPVLVGNVGELIPIGSWSRAIG